MILASHSQKSLTISKRHINMTNTPKEKLRPEIKVLWLDALRSGKYTQGQGALQDDGKFCCLGVLCDIYRVRRRKGSWKAGQFSDTGYRFFIPSGNKSSAGYLPDPVAKWAGLLPRDNTTLKAAQGKLSIMNDDGKSFQQIANYIDKNL
jgi:hypothetical protein